MKQTAMQITREVTITYPSGKAVTYPSTLEAVRLTSWGATIAWGGKKNG